jgi:hypothetical protein
LTLNSDQLGKKGESRFSEICSDGKLTCNPSTHDRTGWDFIVEFPYDPPGLQLSLDKRRSPISCHVQVKTMWSSNDTFRMRLSSAERLAKEPKPAFVYVLKVNKNLEFTGAYLIHMLDENLAVILKRLRREQSKGTKAIGTINKKYIAFRPSRSGQLLPPTGEALRAALISICGSDQSVYIEKKRNQLKSLGFEGRPYEVKTTITVDGHEGLVDVFLGLKEVEIADWKSFETRFGIKLSLNEAEFAKGTMHIQPGRADQCIVTVRESPLSEPATFEADIFFPAIPNLPKEQTKFLVKAKLFKILIDQQRFKFATDEEATKTALLKLGDWLQFLKMLVIFCKGTGTITISPGRFAAGSLPIKFENTDPAKYIYLSQAFEGAQRLLRLAGAPEPMVGLADIVALAQDVIALDRLFSGATDISPLTFTTEWPDGSILPDKFDVIYANFILIAGVMLAHYSVAEMTPVRQGDNIVWKSRTIDPREIVVIQKFPADYLSFVDRAKVKANIKNVIMAQPPDA